MKRFLKWVLALIILGLMAGLIYVASFLVPNMDAKMNSVRNHDAYPVSDQAKALHDRLIVADLYVNKTSGRESLHAHATNLGRHHQVHPGHHAADNALIVWFRLSATSSQSCN